MLTLKLIKRSIWEESIGIHRHKAVAHSQYTEACRGNFERSFSKERFANFTDLFLPYLTKQALVDAQAKGHQYSGIYFRDGT